MTPQPESSLPPPVPPDPLLDPVPIIEVAAQGPPPMGEFSRLVGVFVSPKEAFTDIAKRPRWWIPVILVAIASTAFTIAYSNRVGFDQMIRQTLQNSPQGQNMKPEPMERAIAPGAQH